MKGRRFSLAQQDEAILTLTSQADHRTLALWARACAERVLPHFERTHPQDDRPRRALATLQAWIDSGVFRMAEVRSASLASHAAAREVGEGSAACSAARAAGQAVAVAHVWGHAIAAANYALQAVHRTACPAGAAAAVTEERQWQYQRLLALVTEKAET